MTIAFIYKITNLCTLEFYVGKTFKTADKRFKEHRRASLAGKTQLSVNMRAYGADNFKTEVILQTTREEAATKEREFIALLKPQLNMNKGGGGAEGKWITNGEKTYKIAMSANIPEGFKRGRKLSRARMYIHRDKIELCIFADEVIPDGFSQGRSKTTRDTISVSKMGNTGHLGFKHSETAKVNMSLAHVKSHASDNRKPYPKQRKTAEKNKVTINGVEYLSKHHASTALGISRRKLLELLEIV